MLRRYLRSSAAFALTIVLASAPALADVTGPFGTAVRGANAAIKNAMKTAPAVARVPPVQQAPVGGPQQAGLPTGFTYTADLSVAKPFGDIGSMTQWLPGGGDIVAGYGFDPTTRFVANYYEMQHYPAGFNSGIKPLYLQGFANPIGCVDLSGGSNGGCAPATLDLTTKDRFLLFNFEKLFLIGGMPGGRKLPIVITPTFVSRWSKIAASTQNNDVVPFEPNASDGFPLTDVHTRTAQIDSVAVTIPFLKTSKMFGTFTIAPSWLTRLNGINQQNHAQLYQILYLEYTPQPGTKIFFEPQSSRDYLPTDPWAEHVPAYFLGVAQSVGKTGFIQLVLNSGGPTNEGPYGVDALVCQQLPCAPNQVVPVIGGLKATQLQIQFGIGSPSVIQF
jgi:hypothetical protein